MTEDEVWAAWTEMAANCRRRSAESFERCDTDGFLSQAAADSMALLYGTCAQVAERGGLWDFVEPADLDGNVLGARYVETRYGWSWVWDGPDGQAVWFRESNARKAATRQANNAKKGVKMVLVRREAVVVSAGFGGGSIIPARDGQTAEVVGDADLQDW